ncbi:MAG: Gfo/Idh/MocA family oxidoreductase [Granulosicoccus sp.]|nr:Gfo/Idh/MocA family oxidoreductase [Granulosicoccus sp.]
MATPMKTGLIGTGRISDIYLKTCAQFSDIEIVACGSLDLDESTAKASEFGIEKVLSPDEIIANPAIDCVLNLTVPAAHSAISLAALQAGKHVYSEKPFATTLVEGQKVLDLADAKGLKVGNAPDTFLGGRWQTARKLLDQGIIGEPTGCMAFVGTHGVERHHPNPDFYYQEGGGPLLDLGPYYLTAMVFLLGPVARVSGLARKTFARRQIENGPRNGEWMPVDVDTHSLSMFEFRSGAIGSMTMSFDIWDSETPRFEIYGTEGTLCIPDPDPVHGANDFHGPVWYRTRATSRWELQPRPTDRPERWSVAENTHGFNTNSRGLGLLDLALAVRENREPRASGTLAYHVLEVMLGILDAPERGGFVDISSHCSIPSALPEKFPTE